MDFWLGTHKAVWLERLDVPLFVSHRTLRGRRSLPRARAPWALDSGAFSELSAAGAWETEPREYLAAVERYAEEIGSLAWAAPQDWMCEPWIVARTGLSVAEHQRRTVGSFLELRAASPAVIPVLQGWERGDYLRCAELYAAEGVDLAREPLVGLGSVCRRQATAEAERLIAELAFAGIRLHGFGFKLRGLARCADLLASADSMAWSYDARRAPALAGCSHASCSNCPLWALAWREKALASLRPPSLVTP